MAGPTSEHTCDDPLYGKVRVRAWAGLHSVVKVHWTLGTRRPRPIVQGTVALVEVAKLPGQTRRPRMLRLFWHGPGEPDLSIVWRAYIRRSGTLWVLEHTIRFGKQTLGWMMPRLRSPEQADRWTWLVPAAYTQLRLVRPWIRDKRLPWERHFEANKITPYQVHRAFSSVLPLLGIPASSPKPCGRSPGRPKGCRSGLAALHPVLRKAA